MSPQPPAEMVAPSGVHTAFYILFFVQAAGAIALLVHRARTGRTWLPLAALGGAIVVGYFAPPILNRLTLVWFPSNIPLPYIEAFGMKDPLFDLIGYALFIGFGGWLLCEAIRAGRGARAVWGVAAVWGIADLLYEIPFLELGLFTYYGDQPFTIGGFPAHWVVMNAMVVVVAGTLMHLALERMPAGGARAGTIAIVPALAFAVLMVPAMPVATALNADLPGVAGWIAAVASITVALTTIRICAAVAQRAARASADAAILSATPPVVQETAA